MSTYLQPVPPEDYRAIFDHHPAGRRILEELIGIYSKPPVTDGGIDAVLKTFTRAGERSVIEFIVKKINEANQVPDLHEPGE